MQTLLFHKEGGISATLCDGIRPFAFRAPWVGPVRRNADKEGTKLLTAFFLKSLWPTGLALALVVTSLFFGFIILAHLCPMSLPRALPQPTRQATMTATVNDCSPSLQRKQQQQADVPSGSPSLPPLSPTTRSADKDYTQYWYTPVYTSKGVWCLAAALIRLSLRETSDAKAL